MVDKKLEEASVVAKSSATKKVGPIEVTSDVDVSIDSGASSSVGVSGLEKAGSKYAKKLGIITKQVVGVNSKFKKRKYRNPFSYIDPLQIKFVNCIMKDGKKIIAQRTLRKMFDEINEKGQENVLKCFEIAIKHVTPQLEVRSKRIGGAVYQIPIEVPAKRQKSLAIRWLLEGARKRKGVPIYKKLASEVLDAKNEAGYAFQKRNDSHRMAQANKAFAHFARY